MENGIINEIHFSFTTSHPVYTLNELTGQTKNVWIVCHGYGQLARFFVKRFDVLDPTENFVIAPQGLSRFYSDGNYGRVGATWMTKEDRETDLKNQQAYFDTVFEQLFGDVDMSSKKLKLLGFSQGVTMICRLAVYKRLNFDQLILWAGSVPHEQNPQEWGFIDAAAKIDLVIGDQDQFFSEKTVELQAKKVEELLGRAPKLTVFSGKHEVTREVLAEVAL